MKPSRPSTLASAGLPMELLDRDGALREADDRIGASTRSQFLRRCLGAGGAGLAASLASPAHGAAAGSRDQDILNYALVLEYLQAAFYTEAERLGALHGAFAHQARVVGAHERAHVVALRAALGSAATKPPKFDFRGVTEDEVAFRRTAVAFEDLATAAYKDQAPRIQSKHVLASAIKIHSVEARHAAWIRRLAGRVPAPHAFDQPLPKPQVVRLVADTRFVTSPVTTLGRAKPKFTG